MKTLREIINSNRNDEGSGIYSVCCAHPVVIEAAMEQAKQDGTLLLIESTANQVNQFGGYTDMTPATFVSFVRELSNKVGLSFENIILGGDHLGPVCWTDERHEVAMEKAKVLIKAYVEAGFKKIHLDTSMSCSGDPDIMNDSIVAYRAAQLCKVAEDSANAKFGASDIVYIVGTEVPPPGGATEELAEIAVTPVERVANTLDIHQQAFTELELSDAWQRVIGVVVQPGVEFDHTSIVDFQSSKVKALKHFAESYPNIVFEAHSTDYQKPSAYRDLVNAHFAILKVGPQLTFALREAIFALAHIEQELVSNEKASNIRAVCELDMIENPSNWQRFYCVPEHQQTLYRRYSYSDRIRYYWPSTPISEAYNVLIKNLEAIEIPLPLLSQYLPEQLDQIREGHLANKPLALLKSKVRKVTEIYARACLPKYQSKVS